MNVEFIMLSDGNVAVTDENGHIIKRTDECVNENILLTENKVEIIDEELKKLNKDLNSKNDVLFLCKNMIKSQPLFIFVVILMYLGGGYLFDPLDFVGYGIHKVIEAFVYSVFFSGATIVYFGIVNYRYKNKAREITKKLELAKEIKLELEKELGDLKEKQLDIKKDNYLNNPVSLVSDTIIAKKQINRDLDNRDYRTLDNNTKKLILKKK